MHTCGSMQAGILICWLMLKLRQTCNDHMPNAEFSMSVCRLHAPMSDAELCIRYGSTVPNCMATKPRRAKGMPMLDQHAVSVSLGDTNV